MNDDKYVILKDSWGFSGKPEDTLKLVESYVIPDGPPTGTVLAVLEGPGLDYINPSRNGRKYLEMLCDGIMMSDYVEEMYRTKTFLGEADHPMDVEQRLDIHFPYVSHAIRSHRKDVGGGRYIFTIDILDTPNGRIIKTLIDYGCKLGISSRGAGRVITQNGEDIVDPESYRFITFDLVAMPGNEIARMEPLKISDNVVERYSPVQVFTNKVNEAISQNNTAEVASLGDVVSYLSPESDLRKLKESIDAYLESVKSTTSADDTDDKQFADLMEAYDRITLLKSEGSAKDAMIERLQAEITSLKESANKATSKSSGLIKANASLLQEMKSSERNHQLVISKLEESHNNEMDALKRSLNERHSRTENRLRSRIGDDAEMIRSLSENLGSAEYEIATLTERLSRTEVKLNESQSQMGSNSTQMSLKLNEASTRLTDFSSKYIRMRCTQLGLNESSFIQSLPRKLHEMNLDEVDGCLAESHRRLLQSSTPVSSVKVVGKGTLTESAAQVTPERTTYLNAIADAASSLVDI